jgi:DNA (cytosine-5)-methyltransferase 1
MKKSERPVAIDLFCGAGGMSLGFELAGFDVIAAVDSDPIHVTTHARNFPSCKTLNSDISRLTGDQLREEASIGKRHIDVLFGGPPCQGFSLIGKRQVDDPRNLLIYDFARLVRELQPDYFVVENVQGLFLGKALRIFNSFLLRVRRAGYSYVKPILLLDCSDLGIPQRRLRLFIMGYKNHLPAPVYPKSSIPNNGSSNHSKPTVWDALGDLPEVSEIEDLLHTDAYIGALGTPSEYVRNLRELPLYARNDGRHIERNGISGCLRSVHTPVTVRRFAATEPGTYEPVSRFYRLSKDGVAPTLRAGSGSSHGSFTAPRPIHPEFPRCITVREAARLHSFPDWFDFHPTIWHGFRQVGNSVPPLLASAVAKTIWEALTGSTK